MEKVSKILFVCVVALLLVGAGWNNVFNGIIFKLANLSGDMRLATWDEDNDISGTIKLDTLTDYMSTNIDTMTNEQLNANEINADTIKLTEAPMHNLEINPTGVYLNDTRVTYYFKGFAGFTENTDSVVITDIDSIYRFPGIFSNNLNGFEIGTYGIKYLGGDTLRMLVTAHTYVSFSAPNAILYFGAQLITAEGDTLQSALEPIKALTADVEVLILFEGLPLMPPNSEIELICKASKTGTYTPTTCKTRIREF